MIFAETKLKGSFIVDLERREDERGFFARIFCQKEFAELGLESNVAQANMALSAKRGTLRGMHFQYPPATEAKLVRCLHGAVLDVIVDLRPESATFCNTWPLSSAATPSAPSTFLAASLMATRHCMTKVPSSIKQVPSTRRVPKVVSDTMTRGWPLPGRCPSPRFPARIATSVYWRISKVN